MLIRNLLFAFVLLICQRGFSQKIKWTPGTKLKWSDFQSKAARNPTDNTAAFAYTGIVYEVVKSTNARSPVSIKVTSVFDVQKSWKRSENLPDHILNHEQIHFDIAELYARKIRKLVRDKIRTSGDYDRLFKTEYQKLYDEYMAFQDKYDKETNHGENLDKQKYYNDFVSMSLKNLKFYQQL